MELLTSANDFVATIELMLSAVPFVGSVVSVAATLWFIYVAWRRVINR